MVESGFDPHAQQAPLLRKDRAPGQMEGTHGAGIQIPLVLTQHGFPVAGLVANTPVELTGAKGIGCFISATVDPYYERMAMGPSGKQAMCEGRVQTKLYIGFQLAIL